MRSLKEGYLCPSIVTVGHAVGVRVLDEMDFGSELIVYLYAKEAQSYK